MGKIRLPKSNTAWKADVMTQLLRFPAGKHDDAVDVLSLLGRGLEMVVSAAPTAKSEEVFYAGDGAWMS